MSDACAADPACEASVGDLYSRFMDAFDALDAEPWLIEGFDPTQFEGGRVHLDGRTAAYYVFVLLYRRSFLGDLPLGVVAALAAIAVAVRSPNCPIGTRLATVLVGTAAGSTLAFLVSTGAGPI